MNTKGIIISFPGLQNYELEHFDKKGLRFSLKLI